MISDPAWTARWRGVSLAASWTLELTLAWTLMRNSTLSMSEFCTATWRKLRPLLSTWTETERQWWGAIVTLTVQHVRGSRVTKLVQLCQCYLFCSTWLPLEDSLCCFIVLVCHGTGEGGHPLTVANAETNVWMGNEELYDDIVLVANGSMDGSSAFCVLTEMDKKGLEKEDVYSSHS